MPPFDGPRATLCVTRLPWNICVLPLSMATGTETETDFLHSWRTLTRFGSIAKTSATRRNCSRAISNGFSRRCETGASTVVTSAPFSAQIGTFWLGLRSLLLDRERHGFYGRRPAGGAVREEAQLVRAARQNGAGGVAPGDAERVAAGKHVAQGGQQADAAAGGAPELEVEPRERHHRQRAGNVCHGAGDEAQQRRRGIGRSERVRREPHRGEPRRGARAEQDRPRDVDLVSRRRRDHEQAVGRRLAVQIAGGAYANAYANRSPGRQRQARRPHREQQRGGALVRNSDVKGEVQPPGRDVAQDDDLGRAPARARRASERKRGR